VARPTPWSGTSSYLRRTIDAGRKPLIHTMRGVGYVLKPVD
jgi:two-component system OmpR family response regulator